MATDIEQQRMRGNNLMKEKVLCCCCKISSKTATVVIAVLSVLGSLTSFFSSSNLIQLGVNLGLLSTALLAIYGIWKRTYKAVLPFLVMQLVGIAQSVLMLIVAIIRSFHRDPENKHHLIFTEINKEGEEEEKKLATNEVVILVFLIFIPIQLWLTRIVHRCYQFMKTEQEEIQQF
ncbi:hypothetical protein L596_020779 [Steinernema carpocapsae]|uniref:Uncharacterized protein n=1 Tax=Steinernema carpocapsae TaxID=34508 RepID=A0A4U5MV73_STECR|nr:hypothetical protein L596_020779 [Steinernema carpocapsae]